MQTGWGRKKFKEIISFKISVNSKGFHLQSYQLKENIQKNN